jgi:hypothetical protein
LEKKNPPEKNLPEIDTPETKGIHWKEYKSEGKKKICQKKKNCQK